MKRSTHGRNDRRGFQVRGKALSYQGRLGLALGLWLLGSACYATPYSDSDMSTAAARVSLRAAWWSVDRADALTATAYSAPDNYAAAGATGIAGTAVEQEMGRGPVHDTDVQAWVRENNLRTGSQFDAINACFVGCTLAALKSTTGSIVALAAGAAASAWTAGVTSANIPVNPIDDASAAAAGRHLTMSGSLRSVVFTAGNDLFRVSSLAVAVPEPASTTLLIVGLMALGVARRRALPA